MNMEEAYYTLDFKGVTSYAQMHQVLKESFDFPNDYGGNWDACWDCMTELLGRPIHIRVKGMEVIEKNIPDDVQNLIEILTELKHCMHDHHYHSIFIEIERGRTTETIR